MAQLSPMMQQYMDLKEQYQDAVLFFRLGDFYEMFFDDAIAVSKALELTLTGRDCGMEERAPMCGVPYHAAEQYIDRLIEKGFKVAICEQMEDPSTAKGIVKRGVVRVVTPGTVSNAAMLDEKNNNFLCVAYQNQDTCALAFVDVTTGELYATELDGDEGRILSDLSRYSPKEIVCNAQFQSNTKLMERFQQRLSCSVEVMHDSYFSLSFAQDKLEAQFERHPDQLSVAGHPEAIIAVGVLLEYLGNTQMCHLPHIADIQFYTGGQYMDLDFSTRRNLEITTTMRENKRRGSLLWVLDSTKTSMGARMLKTWIEKPLTSCTPIQRRLSAVEELVRNTMLRGDVQNALSGIQDMERLLSRVVTGSANCRDVQALGNSFAPLPQIIDLLRSVNSTLLQDITTQIDPLEDVCSLVSRAIIDNPPLTIKDGGIIREGFDEKVDIYRKAMNEGKEWIASIEQKERMETGIKTLKIGFNKVFGYYIEVSKSNVGNVPEHYTRKQTLANCERYITGELKEVENNILGAEERICQLEYSLFCDVRDRVAAANIRIQQTAKAIAQLDVLASLAEVAVKNNYCMPHINASDKIEIKDGRHPVVEKVLKSALFVPNDTLLSSKERLSIITGPNMAGKSTYMRQIALIVLMAQMGSFVPAAAADIGLVDKLFTRVGASDDLASGQSTFMVEMSEVAAILENATSKSLLILDEIGRGTSTYDGLSIAWAVVEYIADAKKLGAKTLFATHYHELTELENKIEGVKNYCIAVKKRGDDITFLRKIIRGGADDSYGIEVAKLAGVKREVIRRAKEIVTSLEDNGIDKTDLVKMKIKAKVQEPQENPMQMGMLSMGESELVTELKRLDVMTLTPIEALNKLYQMKAKAEKL